LPSLRIERAWLAAAEVADPRLHDGWAESVRREVACSCGIWSLLWRIVELLELAGRLDIPVAPGAGRSLTTGRPMGDLPDRHDLRGLATVSAAFLTRYC
jgi:hypothetical protein